jgi:hypothetical protein
MIAIIDASVKENTLTKTFKKIALIHIFMRKAALCNYFDERLA